MRNSSDSHIALVGFMCAGKTTVGHVLAARLACPFVDLDDLIDERTGRTAQRIIDEDGEGEFRRVETNALRVMLQASRPLVIATGGGTWTIETNRQIILAHDCLTIWLDAPFDLCWQRIAALGDTRPLAREEKRARELYEERRSVYRLAAHRIEVNPLHSVSDICELIAARIEEHHRGRTDD